MGRQLFPGPHAEADQESRLRTDRHASPGGARACRVVQRQGCGGELQHTAGAAGEDFAAAGEGGAAGFASRDQWRLRAGARSAHHLGIRCDQCDRRTPVPDILHYDSRRMRADEPLHGARAAPASEPKHRRGAEQADDLRHDRAGAGGGFGDDQLRLAARRRQSSRQDAGATGSRIVWSGEKQIMSVELNRMEGPNGIKLPIYMDNHATTPMDPRVLEEMLPYFSDRFGNAASRNHVFGWTAEEAVEQARERIAKLVGATAKFFVFATGATESDNLAIKGVAEMYREKGNHIITAVTEHKAVLDTCKRLEKYGYRVTYLPVQKDGLIDLDDLRRAIDD